MDRKNVVFLGKKSTKSSVRPIYTRLRRNKSVETSYSSPGKFGGDTIKMSSHINTRGSSFSVISIFMFCVFSNFSKLLYEQSTVLTSQPNPYAQGVIIFLVTHPPLPGFRGYIFRTFFSTSYLLQYGAA